MSNLNQLDAKQARQMADDARSMDGVYLRDETNAVLKGIANVAAKGKTEMTSSFTDPIIAARLRNLGYKVIETNDQRDGNFLTVSW